MESSSSRLQKWHLCPLEQRLLESIIFDLNGNFDMVCHKTDSKIDRIYPDEIVRSLRVNQGGAYV